MTGPTYGGSHGPKYRDVVCPACRCSLLARFLDVGHDVPTAVVPAHLLNVRRDDVLTTEQTCPGGGVTVEVS